MECRVRWSPHQEAFTKDGRVESILRQAGSASKAYLISTTLLRELTVFAEKKKIERRNQILDEISTWVYELLLSLIKNSTNVSSEDGVIMACLATDRKPPYISNT